MCQIGSEHWSGQDFGQLCDLITLPNDVAYPGPRLDYAGPRGLLRDSCREHGPVTTDRYTMSKPGWATLGLGANTWLRSGALVERVMFSAGFDPVDQETLEQRQILPAAQRRGAPDPDGRRDRERPVSGSALPQSQGQFIEDDGPVDVAVLVVTYQSAKHIDGLLDSLRREALAHRIRVVVADNSSTDGTLEAVARHRDVRAVPTGGNLGYSAGLNLAARAAGNAGTLFVLNPDARVAEGCIAALRSRMQSSGAGVVVPRIVDDEGSTYVSIRREPTLLRALGDAAFGSRWATRPGRLSEIEGRLETYESAHPIDWATGAALLVDREVAAAVGDWDERFFLYSEETDYLRRVREAGYTVWYEPEAIVEHSQGGSGSSAQLDALMAVNRVRYMAKHHGPMQTALFRGAVILHEAVRSSRPDHRVALRAVLSRASWPALPHAQPDQTESMIGALNGTVIIPAHNEGRTIGRLLSALAPLAAESVDIIVAANGCSDDTVAVARSTQGIVVLDLAVPSKTKALNVADATATRSPRLYVDADVEITPKAVRDTLALLANGEFLAARPPYRWHLDGVAWPVRAYYRARSRVASAHTALWGAGVYGLSVEGRTRFARFPDVVADDLYVDRLFDATEKYVVETDPVVVRVPRTTHELLQILRRQARGSKELRSGTAGSTLRELLATVRGPLSLFDAATYAGFALVSRWPRRVVTAWERDESSRTPGPIHEADQ